MTLQEGYERLKALFEKNKSILEPKEAQKFESAVLNDGLTKVEWEGELQTGTVVFVIDENGGKLPLPVGQYQLEDGSTFDVVDENGTVDNVVLTNAEAAPVEPSTESAPELKSAPVAAAPKAVVKTQIEEHRFDAQKEIEAVRTDLSAKIEEVKEKFEALTKENLELKEGLEKAKETNKELFSIVNQIADEPVKAPTEQKEKFSVKEFRKSWRESIKEIEAKQQK